MKLREWHSFEDSVATVVERSIEFAGRKWKPSRQKAFVVANLCHTLPNVNSKRRCFTPETLANSADSAELSLFDFEHALEYYGAKQDRICGAIAAIEFPSKKKAVELAAKGEPVPLRILLALWRKAAGVEEALEEIATKKNPWRTSMECEWASELSALYDGKTFIPWNECSAEMKDLVRPHTVEQFQGRDMALAMGGADGLVSLTGGALTKWPADKDAKLEQLAASEVANGGGLKLVTGWRSGADWAQAVADANPATDKAALIIGQTNPAEDGHVHDITATLDVLPTNGHAHYLKPVSFDPARGLLEGLTSMHQHYDGVTYIEHAHTIVLGGKREESSAIPLPDLEEIEMKAVIKFLREQATAIEGKDKEVAAAWVKFADALEKETATSDVEATVKARIDAGELVPKAKVDEAVAEAEKTARAKFEKELSEKAAAEKKAAEMLEGRMKSIADAGLNPKAVLSKDRTIESVAKNTPLTDEGEKQFSELLEDWKAIKASTAQFAASTAGAKTADKAAPHAGASASDDQKKPGYAFA